MGKRLNAFPLRSRHKIRTSTLTPSFQQCTRSSASAITIRGGESAQIGNKEVKLPFLAGDVIISIEKLMESIKQSTRNSECS